ncbi:MAG: mercuric transporter MerT family protein [Candidatus Binatia bacterium]
MSCSCRSARCPIDEPHISEEPSGKSANVWVGASLVAALLASACCLGPVVLSALGLSALGISTAFEPLRPYLLGITALFLGVGFYFSYFRQPVCPPGEACAVQNPQLRRANRGLLWVATLAVLAVALFPTYVSSLFAGNSTLIEPAHVDAALTVTLQVDGMTCGACTVSVQQALASVPGVQSAVVSYEESKAVITVDAASRPSIESLVQAVQQTGYTAHPVVQNP